MLTVGLTFDLRDDYLAAGYSIEDVAEFDSAETIDLIEEALVANGYLVKRIGNLRRLVSDLATGKRWDIVFNVCEGFKGLSREAQVPAILEAYEIPFTFSSAATLMLTLDKAVTKILLAERGLPTPAFHVVRNQNDLATLTLPFPVFVKPLAEGTGKGIDGRSCVYDPETLKKKCSDVLNRFNQPALIERFLPGRDLTVGVLGTGESARSIGVLEVKEKKGAEPGGQSLFNKENCERVLNYQLARDATAAAAADLALRCWRALDCRDAGRVDLRCDENGVPYFLEINPLAGLHPSHSDLPILATKVGIHYHRLIGSIMREALNRYEINQNVPPLSQDVQKNASSNCL